MVFVCSLATVIINNNMLVCVKSAFQRDFFEPSKSFSLFAGADGEVICVEQRECGGIRDDGTVAVLNVRSSCFFFGSRFQE